jgi:hypothetical protein
LTFGRDKNKIPRQNIISIGCRTVFGLREEIEMKSKPAALIIILLVAGAFIAGSAGCRKGSQADDYQWITIDEYYTPQNYVEEFIKNDCEQKGLFPVNIRNYGKDASILRRFRGTNFAKSNEAALKMAFPDLEDWMLIDIKYKNEKNQEVLRTVLYVLTDGNWRVGDSGALLK